MEEMEETSSATDLDELFKLSAEHAEGKLDTESFDLITAGENSQLMTNIKTIVDAERALDEAAARYHTLYKRIRGEVESRNVETRMNFENMFRKLIPPMETESVPRWL